jgi:UDP:flavonoid glycosyltransferase YjiC (YdhE family)
MRTILFVWELGAGFGHVTTFRRLAARLGPHRFRFVAAVANLASASVLAAEGVEILQAPLWPGSSKSAAQRAALSSATLGDTLGGFGLGDEEALRTLIGAWDRLIAAVAPDLVIADYAPAASLVARGKIPLALIGNGFTLPPAEVEKFPLLHNLSPPLWPEDRLVEIVNSSLRAFGLQPLERLPQLFAGDVRWVQTFPLLDPYSSWRGRPVEGPLLERLPDSRRADAQEILVYISGQLGPHIQIVELLRSAATRVRIFAPLLPRDELERLASCGVRIENAPFRLAEDLASARLIVHHGSSGGVSAEALIAGVPQLVLSLDIEKDLTGAALERAGIGKLVKIHDPAVSVSSDTIEQVLHDEAIADQAREVGNFHRLMFQNADPFSDFESSCMNLMA